MSGYMQCKLDARIFMGVIYMKEGGGPYHVVFSIIKKRRKVFSLLCLVLCSVGYYSRVTV